MKLYKEMATEEQNACQERVQHAKEKVIELLKEGCISFSEAESVVHGVSYILEKSEKEKIKEAEDSIRFKDCKTIISCKGDVIAKMAIWTKTVSGLIGKQGGNAWLLRLDEEKDRVKLEQCEYDVPEQIASGKFTWIKKNDFMNILTLLTELSESFDWRKKTKIVVDYDPDGQADFCFFTQSDE